MTRRHYQMLSDALYGAAQATASLTPEEKTAYLAGVKCSAYAIGCELKRASGGFDLAKFMTDAGFPQ
jgi:hypothetical protein